MQLSEALAAAESTGCRGDTHSNTPFQDPCSRALSVLRWHLRKLQEGETDMSCQTLEGGKVHRGHRQLYRTKRLKRKLVCYGRKKN